MFPKRHRVVKKVIQTSRMSVNTIVFYAKLEAAGVMCVYACMWHMESQDAALAVFHIGSFVHCGRDQMGRSVKGIQT